MTENFITYEAFPYDPNNFLGKETALLNIFTFWKHYQSKYASKLAKASVVEDEYEEWREKEGQKIKSKEEEIHVIYKAPILCHVLIPEV